MQHNNPTNQNPLPLLKSIYFPLKEATNPTINSIMPNKLKNFDKHFKYQDILYSYFTYSSYSS